jgi:hypothetical protein
MSMSTEWRWLKVPRRESLSAEAHVGAGFHEAREGEGFGHAVVDGALAGAHFGALLEKFFYFGMDVEAFGIGGEAS